MYTYRCHGMFKTFVYCCHTRFDITVVHFLSDVTGKKIIWVSKRLLASSLAKLGWNTFSVKSFFSWRMCLKSTRMIQAFIELANEPLSLLSNLYSAMLNLWTYIPLRICLHLPLNETFCKMWCKCYVHYHSRIFLCIYLYNNKIIW